MNEPRIRKLLNPVLQKDRRYGADAYIFVQKGLGYTVRKFEKPRHVRGKELLEGLREYALQEYGPLARRVFAEWGINKCIDFGNIVFNLINEGWLRKSEKDSIEDFMDGYDFHEAFILPFKAGNSSARSNEQNP